MTNPSSTVKRSAITRNSISTASAVTRDAVSSELPRLSNISSTKPLLHRLVLSLTHANTPLTVQCFSMPLSSLLLYLFSPCMHYHESYSTCNIMASVALFPHFDFLSIKGAWTSCLSARQVYLSLSHPLFCSGLSTALIPYQPASHPSPHCPSRQIHPSAHLCRTAHARRWSPQSAQLESHTGRRGQQGRTKLEGNTETKDGRGKKRLYPARPLSACTLSACIMSLRAY